MTKYIWKIKKIKLWIEWMTTPGLGVRFPNENESSFIFNFFFYYLLVKLAGG
jgi:hypothetical protein